jgi:MFS family permease
MTPPTAFVLLLGLTLGAVFMNIPPALSVLMALYRVSYTGISVLMSALLWSHALMQVPAGVLADRLGSGRTLLLSLLCIGTGSVIPAVAPAMALAVGGRVVAGVGTGLGFVAGLKLVALYAPRERTGTFQAFFGGFFSIGSILSYLLIPHLIGFGWRWAYLAPGLLCLPLLAMLGRLRLPSPMAPASPPLSLGRVVQVRAGWVLGVYHALSYGSMLCLGNWVPSLMAEVWKESAVATLAWGGALVMLISGVGRLSGGVILLRLSPLLLANGSIGLLSVTFLGLTLVSLPATVLTLALLAAWFGSVNFGAFFHLASKVTAVDSLGTFIGFVNLLANLGAVLFTLMFGVIKDTTGSFAWGFGVLALLSLTAVSLGHAVLRPPPAADAVAE